MKFEYRESTNYSQPIDAVSLEDAIQQAEDLLRNGDWDVELGYELHAVLAEMDDDGNQIRAHDVTAIYGE